MSELSQVYQCDYCGLVVAERRAGLVVIRERRGSERHETGLDFDEDGNVRVMGIRHQKSR
jgi:hypothetical protein